MTSKMAEGKRKYLLATRAINSPAQFAPVLNPQDVLDDLQPALVGRVTTDHPASIYGVPVFVTASGDALGSGDAQIVGRRLYLGHGRDSGSPMADAVEYDRVWEASRAAGYKMEDY